MPLVGAAKRRAGLPLEVPEREAIVLDAAIESARAAAERADVAPPPMAATRRLFLAQMNAAKEVQWESVRDPQISPADSALDLETQLRPALLRIGDRIAQLLVTLPAGLDASRVREEALRELRTPRLSKASALALADAISALSQPQANQRDNADAAPGTLDRWIGHRHGGGRHTEDDRYDPPTGPSRERQGARRLRRLACAVGLLVRPLSQIASDAETRRPKYSLGRPPAVSFDCFSAGTVIARLAR
jgi:chorismate mutase